MKERPAGLLPQDEEPGVCVFCGYRGSYPKLIRTVLPIDPGQVVRRCFDSSACIRRRMR